MATFAISASLRAADEKVSHMRKSKKVPGVVYGKTQDPIAFCVDSSDFLRLYRKAWESNIINLKVGKEEIEVLIHQTQKHPVTWEFTHVDFYAITRGQALQTKISFIFVWEAPAKKEWAIVEEMMREIEVKCRPRDLVDHFDVDLSVLDEAGKVIRVSDLNLDSEIYEVLANDDDVIASAQMPRAVVEEATEEGEEGEAEWEEGKATEGSAEENSGE